MARPDLILSLSAFGRPRSANTLPEPGSISMPSIMRFLMPHLLCQRLGYFQPGANDVHVLFRRGDATLAFLLEAVEGEHRFPELHGVDGTVCAAGIVFDHFQDAGAAETLEYLRRAVLVTMLREIQCVPKKLSYADRKRHQVLPAAPDPDERL